jgi:hypothetical protein
MDLREQQIPGSHIVFGNVWLESQIHTMIRPQKFMSVFPHFQSVYSSSQLLWFISLTWARFMYGKNTVRILKFNSQDYEKLFKLLLNVLSFYISLKNTLPLLWTRQQIRRAYSKWSPYSSCQCTDLSNMKEPILCLFLLFHILYMMYNKPIRYSTNLWWQ